MIKMSSILIARESKGTKFKQYKKYEGGFVSKWKQW